MGGGVSWGQLALALALPAVLTLSLAPLTLWLNARRNGRQQRPKSSSMRTMSSSSR